jgi:hypothetical protein
MADPKNDIISNVEISETDVSDLKKAHYQQGGGTRTAAPVQQLQTGLNAELVQMLKMGKKYSQFQGIDRCIRVINPGAPSQRHCFSMMVKDMGRNMFMCSSCDRVRDVNANPKTINSSMIKLTDKELEEFHMTKDPLANSISEPVKKPKVSKEFKPAHIRRPKMAGPKTVKIEVGMSELEKAPNAVSVLLQKTLAAIYDLPVTKFSEAEEIRVVSERIKLLISEQGDN